MTVVVCVAAEAAAVRAARQRERYAMDFMPVLLHYQVGPCVLQTWTMVFILPPAGSPCEVVMSVPVYRVKREHSLSRCVSCCGNLHQTGVMSVLLKFQGKFFLRDHCYPTKKNIQSSLPLITAHGGAPSFQVWFYQYPVFL